MRDEVRLRDANRQGLGCVVLFLAVFVIGVLTQGASFDALIGTVVVLPLVYLAGYGFTKLQNRWLMRRRLKK